MKKLKSKNKKNKEFFTWDQFCLFKLQEIGKSSMRQWAEAMGYNNANSLCSIIKHNSDKLKITPTPTSVRRSFEIKEGVII